jgi:hypothetical protein
MKYEYYGKEGAGIDNCRIKFHLLEATQAFNLSAP